MEGGGFEDGGWEVGGKDRVWRWGVGSGWEREGLEMGRWEGWVMGGRCSEWEVGRIRRRKSNTVTLFA